ncbi:DUF5305 domain-containing protein [Halohasta litorea]|uniref:DUF5305 domain-containing protein n=1 Tax=Halohasta litorea TaxID=869891 RepID=A0ABD6D8H6_9EURY|nr:DUF5305 domain-containing protein [Halohasta litorea]
MDDWRRRARAVLDNQFVVVCAVLLGCVLVGGWLTYTAHVGAATTTEQQSTVSWEQTGAFDHSATVQEDNSLFPVGTTLENRSVYYTRLSPELDGTFRTTYDARESGDLDQDVSLSLVLREVDPDSEGTEPTVYWQTSSALDDATVESVPPGEPVRVSFSQDMSAVTERIGRIQEELGGSTGEVEVFVRATITAQGKINGDSVDETATYTMPVTVSDTTYSVTDAEPTVESYETTRPVTVDRNDRPLRSVGGPLLLVVALGLLGGVVRSDRSTLSETERARLAYEDDRETFDEWISTIELPSEAFELPQADADSLAGLVDFAIDTDNSVIEDPDDDAYYVRHDGYLYCYRPPRTDSDDGETTDSVDSETESTDGTELDEGGIGPDDQ